MIPKSGSRFSGKSYSNKRLEWDAELGEESSCSSERPSFDAHLRARNTERLQFASWYFAAVMLALVAAEVVVPVLWSTVMIVVQVISALYFCALAWVWRTERAATWPTQALPLLFGAGTIATGLLLSLNLAPRFGATPAYATTVFVACLAPL